MFQSKTYKINNNMQYKIGIDIGGTNTDAVLLNNKNEILAKTKMSTSQDVSTGIEQALSEVLSAIK